MGINIDLSDELKEKYEKLEKIIRNYGSLAVGFSGGVDSTLLLTVAADVLGDRALAVTNVDAGVPERELREAREFCELRGIRHVFCETNPLEIKQYRFNSPDRCYYCKRAIFERITELAKKNGTENVAEGSNVDDEGDYRPGLRAVAERVSAKGTSERYQSHSGCRPVASLHMRASHRDLYTERRLQRKSSGCSILRSSS